MPSPDPVGRAQQPLTVRAARFFGWHDKPRVSVRVNDGAVVVGEHGGRKLLMVYHERGDRLKVGSGTLVNLTERQRVALVEALGGEARA